jgi:hypothetical protein
MEKTKGKRTLIKLITSQAKSNMNNDYGKQWIDIASRQIGILNFFQFFSCFKGCIIAKLQWLGGAAILPACLGWIAAE